MSELVNFEKRLEANSVQTCTESGLQATRKPIISSTESEVSAEKFSTSQNVTNISIINSIITGDQIHLGRGDISKVQTYKENSYESLSREPSSIDNVRVPPILDDLKETETIRTAFNKVRNENKFILHCYGLPGSGKSVLVRFLAQKFPYVDKTVDENLPVFIKWHIQCKDSNDDLKKEFQSLVEKLLENNFINKGHPIWQNIKEDFRKNNAKMFLKILQDCKASVLIVLEDPTEDCRDLLQSFFKLLAESDQDPLCSRFHIYVTSRKMSPIIPSKVSQRLKCYEVINVNGFNEEEGSEFLKRSDSEAMDEEEELIKVYRRFSGMPLGLLAAKSYCQYTKISYKQYLQLVEDTDYDISFYEKEAVLEEYGQSAEHIFQAIVILFMPEGQFIPSVNASLDWHILCCISSFHYDCVPRFLLEACCHAVRENKVKMNPDLRNKNDITMLVRKLLNCGMCTELQKEEITFHEVVLNAFRFKAQKSVESFNPIKKAMEAICGLMTMDIRRKKNCDRMNKLRPHFQTLLKHVDRSEEKCGNIMQSDLSFFAAITSHMNEVAGAIVLYELRSEKSEKFFHDSLEIIWPEKLHLSNRQNLSKEEIAEDIVEKSQIRGKKLPEDFLLSYASYIWLSHFEEAECEFLRSRSKRNFEGVEEILKNLDPKANLVKELQRCDLFLSNERFRPIFLAERFASIMHRWSRYCLTVDTGDATSIEKGLWLSSLSNAVSRCVREKTGIHLLTEWLSFSSGLIPFVMKQKNNPESLQRAQNMCNEMMEKKNLTVYENGLLKSVSYPPEVSQMFLLRNLVRINARLVSTNSRNEAFLLKADKECEQLLDLANGRVNMSIGSSLIYCGKYYGAKGDLTRALQCFKQYFDLSSTPGFEQKFHTECWAVYNYARAICCQPSSPGKEDAIKRCRDVLKANKVVKEDIKRRLEEFLSHLETLS